MFYCFLQDSLSLSVSFNSEVIVNDYEFSWYSHFITIISAFSIRKSHFNNRQLMLIEFGDYSFSWPFMSRSFVSVIHIISWHIANSNSPLFGRKGISCLDASFFWKTDILQDRKLTTGQFRPHLTRERASILILIPFGIILLNLSLSASWL